MIKTTMLLVIFAVANMSSSAANLEQAALEILTGKPISTTPPVNAFVVEGDGTTSVVGSNFTMSDIRAITNRADVLALAAAQDAPAIALAAEITSLESDLTNAVKVAFGVMPPYSANVQANYRTTLRTQMQKARADIAAATTLAQLRTATTTLNQRQEIINLVRELRAVKPDWSLRDLQ